MLTRTRSSNAREDDDIFLSALKTIDSVDFDGLDDGLVHGVVLRQEAVDLRAQLIQLLFVRTEHADLILELIGGYFYIWQ